MRIKVDRVGHLPVSVVVSARSVRRHLAVSDDEWRR